MEQQLKVKLTLWAQACEEASETGQLQIIDPIGTLAECKRRLQLADESEKAILDITQTEGAPKELIRYQAAVDDPPCDRCYVSAHPSLRHNACQAKLDEYWAARESLLASITSGVWEQSR